MTEHHTSKRWLTCIEESVGVVLLVLIFGSIGLQVVTRFVLRDPLFWTEEAARYLFVWLVVIGSAEVIRTRSHIAMDAFVQFLPVRAALMLDLFRNLLIITALVILAWYGWAGMLRAHRVMSVALGVPGSLLYGALPIGAILMAIRTAFNMKNDLHKLCHPDAVDTGTSGGKEHSI